MQYIYLRTIGTVNEIILDNIVQQLSGQFPFPFKIIKNTEYPLYAFEAHRNQCYSKKIVEKLVSELPADCEKLLGITDVDLCTPILTFIFGEAQLGGRVAIVSYNRLRQEFYHLPQNNALFYERLLKECVHELGHCYGLFHCNNSKCVMFFSNNIFDVDGKHKHFCMRCKEYVDKKMRKEHHEKK